MLMMLALSAALPEQFPTDIHDASPFFWFSKSGLQLMLMMLGRSAGSPTRLPADAHDAGPSAWFAKNGFQLMLMMLVLFCWFAKTVSS